MDARGRGEILKVLNDPENGLVVFPDDRLGISEDPKGEKHVRFFSVFKLGSVLTASRIPNVLEENGFMHNPVGSSSPRLDFKQVVGEGATAEYLFEDTNTPPPHAR